MTDFAINGAPEDVLPHDTTLITTIVAALVLAFVFGTIANRLRIPPLVGYLIAGVLVGPFTPGFVADQKLAAELAELGVILLMFGVGLHFSLSDLLSVRTVAVPGALLRIAGGTALGLGLATLMGWSLGAGLIFGLALSVASTVVLLRGLQERRLMDSERGRIAVGWVIVEDFAMVLALVLIPALAGVSAQAANGTPDPFIDLVQSLIQTRLNLYGVLGVTVVKLAAFVGFMLVVGRRLIPLALHWTAHTGSRELFRLAVLAIALGVAAGASYLFGVSLALGAFFAGMILSESELSHRAAEETLPLRDAFSVLFFVSVGMLFDPSIIVRDPLPVLATVLIVIFGKSIIAYLVIRAARRPPSSALVISASLAQVGEFSFILAALGTGLGILPQEGTDLILAAAMISIVLNPIVIWWAESLRPRLDARRAVHAELDLGPVVPGAGDGVVNESVLATDTHAAPDEIDAEIAPTRLTNHIVLIGFGRVGSVVGTELKLRNLPFLVIEDGDARIIAARELGLEVIPGNAASHEVLTQANVAGARAIVIAIPNAFEAGQATEQARKLNEHIRIIARAHLDEEVDYLEKLGANRVIMGEREIGLGMIEWVNDDLPETSAETVPVTGTEESVAGVVATKLAVGENLLSRETDENGANPQPSGIAIEGVPTSAPESSPVYLSPDAMPEPEHVHPGAEGPAEPPGEVPSLGEMPDEDAPNSEVEVDKAGEPKPEVPESQAPKFDAPTPSGQDPTAREGIKTTPSTAASDNPIATPPVAPLPVVSHFPEGPNEKAEPVVTPEPKSADEPSLTAPAQKTSGSADIPEVKAEPRQDPKRSGQSPVEPPLSNGGTADKPDTEPAPEAPEPTDSKEAIPTSETPIILPPPPKRDF